MPDLNHKKNDGVATVAKSFEDKVSLLSNLFFSNATEADLSDIAAFRYRTTVEELSALIDEDEIIAAIKRCKPDSAAGPDEIPNRVLKLLTSSLLPVLRTFFRACAARNYHPRCFREAHTIPLKKPHKEDYTAAKAYRPIAFLNTLEKALKSIIARRISSLAEAHKLLPEAQMKGRKNRSCETALELLIEQIHTVWNMGDDKVTTLLNMDVAGAYDHVSAKRLLHNLRKRGMPH